MLPQFLTLVCDRTVPLITSPRDDDHKHKCGATILPERGAPVRAPYGLNILDNCLTCPVREEHLFCNLSVHAGQRLNEIKSTAVYPKGAMLFIEGQQPRGVFVLCAGKAKLSTSSREGKTIITKISEAGDVLGLNSVVSNRPYEVTAEMMEPGQANFIPRDSLIQFLKDNGEVALRVAEQLSRNYYTAYEEIRTLGLSTSPSEKFAKLLLSWSTKSATERRDLAGQAHADPRGDCGDHRDHPRNCQPPVFRIQEKTAAAAQRIDPGHPQPAGAGKNRPVLTGRATRRNGQPGASLRVQG